MGWIVGLLIMILLAIVGGIWLLSWQIGVIGTEVRGQLARIRLELGAGLGVNLDDPHGYLDGGHLEEVRDYIRDRRKEAAAERKAQLERDAQF